MTQRITISPDPPVPGDEFTICYDFAGTGLSSVTLTVDYYPDGIPNAEVTLTPQENCKKVTAPTGVTSGFIIDPTGWSDTLGFVC